MNIENLSSLNLPYLEEMLENFKSDPQTVDPIWHDTLRWMANGALGGPPEMAAATAAPIPKPAKRKARAGKPMSVGQTDEALYDFLRQLSIFHNLSDENMRTIAEIVQTETFAAKSYIYRQGEVGTDMMIVASGSVSVRRGNRLVCHLGVGEVVGELSVLDREVRSADVLAETEVRLLRISREDFQGLLETHPTFTRELLMILVERVRDTSARQLAVGLLVQAYRARGHVLAKIDPLDRSRGSHPELTLAHYGLNDADLERPFSVMLGGDIVTLPLRQIIDRLRGMYCGAIGIQYTHIDDIQIQNWIRKHFEEGNSTRTLDRKTQLRILKKLTAAETFEQFLGKKYRGAKRFSLEGTESLIPLLEEAIESAGTFGTKDIVIGMAHRGRLNVLVNTMGKPYSHVFREYDDVDRELYMGRGDVKYHLGYSRDHVTESGNEVHLTLAFNPSHLEFVGPVVLGRARAKQDRHGDQNPDSVLPIVIHGDAAFSGQGVVQELFNLSDLPGYTTGGAVHVIVNNQIGFTTIPQDSRSTMYATDVAKMLQIPIFHVNGEDPEAVHRVIEIAMAFRYTFHRDVVIDLYGYRKHGHNEGDEPRFTQPLMYDKIAKRPTVLESYTANLLKLEGITADEAEQIKAESNAALEEQLELARSESFVYPTDDSTNGLWSSYRGGPDSDTPHVETAIAAPAVPRLLEAMSQVPDGFQPHRKILRFLKERGEMARGERALNWGGGEALAFASLLAEGTSVRISGQDSQRGTFSHRHAVLHDVKTDETYTPADIVASDGAALQVYNSPLSETGVLGFDYGYSLDTPDGLVIWEAQFGDFANGAQVIIDQFITSTEDKWRRFTGIVLLLPHGFEGQGPEHSSARLERFLTLAADDNIQVVNLTTPAQYFHCLRRQVVRPWRKPLIVMSPKGLLRHKQAVSSLEAFSEGQFHRVIPEVEDLDPKAVNRVILCSGKVYYDLVTERTARKQKNVAIVRVEQLYPLSEDQILEAVAPYGKKTPIVWVQEEPENMGAWPFMRVHFGETIRGGKGQAHPFSVVARARSASPATGSKAAHEVEQKEIMDRALN